MELLRFTVGPWPMNSYVLRCPTTQQSVLIDPGAEPDTLLAALADSTPVAILLTHTHPDHVGALEEMRLRLGVPVMAHSGPHVQGMELQKERTLHHGEAVRVGQHLLRVHHTPGHTADMLCFALENDHRCIVGDTLFDGGPGKTWSSADFQTTLQTLEMLLLTWPDEMTCYPGHGPAFRLGDLRAAIQQFLAREHGNFFGDATW
ncbi:MAG: MBL fold metallo-hydrolase [Ardenticatenales bacterium]|nr:MBL fold metallo-hydrolase [Ardenticatenales bacterium]